MDIDYKQIGFELLGMFLKHASEFEHLLTEDKKKDLAYGTAELTKYAVLYHKTNDEKYKQDIESAKLMILSVDDIKYKHEVKAYIDNTIDVIKLALKIAAMAAA